MTDVHFGHYSRFDGLDGMTLVDMHSHSTFSDGRDDALKCVKRAMKLGINLCLTDHNAIQGSLAACDRGFSLPSVEVTSRESYDFLLYFYRTRDLSDFYETCVKGHRLVEQSVLSFYRTRWRAEELLQRAKKYNAVVVVPHPDAMPPKNSGLFLDANRELLRYVDAVEGINSTMSEASNRQAIHYAKVWKKPMTGCSDAHLSRFIGAGITAFESSTVADILEDIRRGRDVVVGNNLRFLYKLQSTMTVLRNNLRWQGMSAARL